MQDCDNSNYLLKHNIANQEQFSTYLTKKYTWAADYVYYYVYVVYAIRDSIIPILGSISEKDQHSFSQEKAYNYLKSYEQSRLSLGIVIPTCNRPKAIEYLLNYGAVLYRRFGIDVVIYDSSGDDETKAVAEKMYKNGYYNVVYRRYTGEFDGFSLDHKIINAYKEFDGTYDYIWMCRDGLIPVVDEIIEKIRHYAKMKIGCFIVDTKSRTNGVEIERIYSSAEDSQNLLLEQADRLQTLGMLIFSSEYARTLIEKEPLSDENYSLWQMVAPIRLFAREPYKIVFFTKNVFAPNYGAATTHFWSKAEKLLEQWAYRWHHVITSLPKQYDGVKKECMMVYTVDFHPFMVRNVLEMGGWGGLSLKLVKKYKKYLQAVTKTPLWIFYFSALVPNFIDRLIVRIIQHFPNLTKKLRHGVLSK